MTACPRTTGILVGLICLAATLVQMRLASAAELSHSDCSITSTEKHENAKLSFEDFDQNGTGRATWRQLISHGCEAEAVESAEDYLIHAHFEQAREQKDVLFHVAQSLGMLGKNDEAALLVAAAKEPLSDPAADLDWNTYLDGTWYFLKHDRDGLKRSELKLGQEAGAGNNLNHNVLAGLLYCFDKPYEIAYGEACRTHMAVDKPAKPRKE